MSGKPRQLRAFFITATVGVILMLPIVYAKYLERARPGIAGVVVGEVPSFSLQGSQGLTMSDRDLIGKVTLVATLPDAQNNAQTAAQALTTWVEGHLLYADKTEATPVRLVAIGPGAEAMPVLWQQFQARDAQELHLFLPKKATLREPSLSVIDQDGQIRFSGSLLDPRTISQAEPLLSRLVMSHYLNDYLAKRTFFERRPKESRGG